MQKFNPRKSTFLGALPKVGLLYFGGSGYDIYYNNHKNKKGLDLSKSFFTLVFGATIPPRKICFSYFFKASSTATAQATVIPTMGLLPAPIRPIISTHFETVDK